MLHKGQIIDIQIVGNQVIQIREALFEVKDIEQTVEHIPYKGQGLVKDSAVEHAKLPKIAKVFYELVFLSCLPTPEQLLEKYLKRYFLEAGTGYFRLKSTGELYSGEGIKGRVFRAYPSLLRDFHFYTLCQSSGKFERVEYSFLTDTEKGIDIMLTYKGVEFGISLFVNTARSMKFKDRKYGRHDYSDYLEICLPIDPFDRKNYIGDYALYNTHHIENMITEMDDILFIRNHKAVCH